MHSNQKQESKCHPLVKKNEEKENTSNKEFMFSSHTAFSKLKLTNIEELNIGETAKGKCIMVRVIIECFPMMDAWSTGVQDHRGRHFKLAFFFYPLDELLLPGDVIVIKEPFVKLSSGNMLAFRCISPTDIIVLRPSHPLYHLAKSATWKNETPVNDSLTAFPRPSDSLQWKVRGNELFARGQLIPSREAYYFGLKLCSDNDPISKIIQLNLLAVQLRLGYFEWVIENGEKFLQKFPEEPKAYFRLGKAHHMLRNYEKALETYEIFSQKFPEDKIGLIELEKAKERFRESNGEFDFDKLRKLSLAKPFEKIDCADFCGLVKIAKVPGKGRGLILTKDVNEGDVVLVSKALAANLDRKKIGAVDIKEINARIKQLTPLIMKNPMVFGKQIYDLCSGRTSSEPAQLFCDPEQKNEPIIDVELIKDIIGCNSFTIFEIMQNGKIKAKGGGLFLLPSYFNHSCISNAKAEFYNDVMVVKACIDMKKGTEVTGNYIPGELSFEERTKVFAERGFICGCPICMLRL